MAMPKRPKLSTSLHSSVDRISALPDSLISHILSFLPTKHAVGTSILSTRWKFLWTSITNLDFDDCLFFCPPNPDDHTDDPIFVFTHFVNRVLLLLNHLTIHKFRLKCKSCDDRYVSSWTDAAVARGTQELDLCMIQCGYQPLPRKLFTSVTLVVLKLEGPLQLNISTTSVSFPNLKILHLSSVYYGEEGDDDNDDDVDDDEDDDDDHDAGGGGECVSKLFSNCPVLEELAVKRDDWDGISCFSICSPLLKKLDIHFDRNGNDRRNDWRFTDAKLEINAPALEYLYLKDHWSMDFAFENLPSLIEATVDINLCKWRHRYDDDYFSVVYKILEGVSKVKFLSLSGYTMKSLTCGSNLSAPEFRNLKKLKVQFNNKSHECKVIPKLIQYSNKLEELVCT